jgi:hypothetical protein
MLATSAVNCICADFASAENGMSCLFCSAKSQVTSKTERQRGKRSTIPIDVDVCRA